MMKINVWLLLLFVVICVSCNKQSDSGVDGIPVIKCPEEYAYISKIGKEKAFEPDAYFLFIQKGIDRRLECDIVPGGEVVNIGTNNSYSLNGFLSVKAGEGWNYQGEKTINDVECWMFERKTVWLSERKYFDVISTNLVAIEDNPLGFVQTNYYYKIKLSAEQWASAFSDTNSWLRCMPNLQKYKK